MTAKQIQKLPPTVIVTTEYDIFREEAYDFADKLKKAEKLLDFSDYASVTHWFKGVSPNSVIIDQYNKDFDALLKTYLIN